MIGIMFWFIFYASFPKSSTWKINKTDAFPWGPPKREHAKRGLQVIAMWRHLLRFVHRRQRSARFHSYHVSHASGLLKQATLLQLAQPQAPPNTTYHSTPLKSHYMMTAQKKRCKLSPKKAALRWTWNPWELKRSNWRRTKRTEQGPAETMAVAPAELQAASSDADSLHFWFIHWESASPSEKQKKKKKAVITWRVLRPGLPVRFQPLRLYYSVRANEQKTETHSVLVKCQ